MVKECIFIKIVAINMKALIHKYFVNDRLHEI